MKAFIIFVLILMQVSICSYSQEKYQNFIQDVSNIYNNKYKKSYMESNITMIKDNKIKKERIHYSYFFIPRLLLKKSKNIYKNIDSTNLVQYFDPKSMYYHQALVSIDSVYIGEISSVMFGNVETKVFNPKPRLNNFVYETLFSKLMEINPEIVFTVQNVGEYYYIKDEKLFALGRWESNDFTVYEIDVYTEKYKEDIFDVFFQYEPRIKEVLCY